MEQQPCQPMILGTSPVGSPAQSPQIHPSNLQTNAQTSSFYPSYLFGESQTSMSRIPPGSISPGRPRQFSSSNSMTSPSSPSVASAMNKDSFFPNTRLGGDRPGGPPTLSLMGGIPQSPAGRIHNSSFVEHQKFINSPLGNQQPSCYNSPSASHSMIQQPLTPFTPTAEQTLSNSSVIYLNNQTKEPLEDSWVTVYGYPVSSASHILTQFAQLGTIVDHRQPGSGNWMHLKYQTKLQARKALSKNSKIFNGNIMVGVVPCADTSITGEKENLNASLCSIMSPKEVVTTPKSNMRPLTQAYQASRADIEVTSRPNTPKKNDGLVARAMQHILGI